MSVSFTFLNLTLDPGHKDVAEIRLVQTAFQDILDFINAVSKVSVL